MQSELRLVKEFRKKRAQMQRELDEVCTRNRTVSELIGQPDGLIG